MSKLQTYAESVGAEVVDWYKVINKFINNDEIDVVEHSEFKDKAHGWKTGYVSSIPAMLDHTGESPTDKVLVDLDGRWYTAFCEYKFSDALAIMSLIDAHADYLMRKLKIELINKETALKSDLKKNAASLKLVHDWFQQ